MASATASMPIVSHAASIVPNGSSKMPHTELPSDEHAEMERNSDDLPHKLVENGRATFFGRSEELEALRKVKQHVLDNNSDSSTPTLLLPAVLVWGVSGTGKSHLIQQFLDETKQQSTCYILQGKYDEYTGSSDPFSALVQALDEFSSQLKDGPVEELERIRKCVKAAFGNEDDDNNIGDSSVLSALIAIVPSLSILLGDSHTSGMSALAGNTDASSAFDLSSLASTSSRQPLRRITSNNVGVNESAWNRLQYIFLQFVKAISTKERPVYMFLDDLQWSSHVALELLTNLVSDTDSEHFLFLGSIRQETNPHTDEVLEITTSSALSASFLSRLHSQSKELTHVTIQNLSLDDTKHFLASLLGDHSINDHLNVLAQKIHVKTQGNIFFTMQALEELKRNNYLIYDQTSFQWEWSVDTINGDDIAISDSIVGVIESKLKQLPQDLQDVLTIAAYVRAAFDAATLLHVVQSEQQCAGASPLFTSTTQTITNEYLSSLLEKAVLEQLVSNPVGGTNYRFVHDRIQQAAHGMIPQGETQNMLRLRIGHCLLKLYRKRNGTNMTVSVSPTGDSATLSKQKEDHQASTGMTTKEDDHGLLFVAADHLNSVPTKDHTFSVMLNLEVGEQAIQMAALASAAGYLEKAADELKYVKNAWVEHYDISLRLHRARCDVELSLGHFQFGYSVGDEVLDNAKTPDEKLPTYLSMARGLGREDRHLEAFKICLRATTQVGEFPKRWYLGHIATGTMKIKAFLKKNSDDAILRLSLMTNERKLVSMKLLTELVLRSFLTQNMVIWLVNIYQKMLTTIRFGLCENSAVAFSCYGLLAGSSGDQATAMRCAGLAQRILSKTKGKSVAGWVCVYSTTFILPYQIPIADAIQKYRKAYKSSMEAGEFETAFMNSQIGCTMGFLGGYELRALVQATEDMLQQSKIYQVESMGSMTAEYLSIMRMMIGKKPIDWDEIETEANRDIKNETLDSSQSIALSSHFFCRMALATYFGKYDIGKKLSDLYRDISSEENTSISVNSRGIFPAINAAGRYRETGKRKHLRRLKKILAELKDVTKKRGSKFIHHVLMLKAELASIQKHGQNSPSVKEAYDMAIMVACSISFVQDAAWTCELAGEHCIREGCSKAETSAYFVKAVGYYEDWGCIAKVDDIKQRRSEYLTGLDENRRVANTTTQDGQVVLFGNQPSREARADIFSSFTPTPMIIGSSVTDSGTKMTFGMQTNNVKEEDNLSVLTDGSR